MWRSGQEGGPKGGSRRFWGGVGLGDVFGSKDRFGGLRRYQDGLGSHCKGLTDQAWRFSDRPLVWKKGWDRISTFMTYGM